jgi:hypothetical protein
MMSGEEVRNQMISGENFNIKSSYIIAQVSHIIYKKDNAEIPSATVSEWISKSCSPILCFFFVKPSLHSNVKVKVVMRPKNAEHIKLENDSKNETKCSLTYHLSNGNNTMTQWDETYFPSKLEVVLILPSFSLLITVVLMC